MDIYKPQIDRKRKKAQANNLDSLKEAIAAFYKRDDPHSVIIYPDGSVSLRNTNNSVHPMRAIVKQITRKQTITGYVFMLTHT